MGASSSSQIVSLPRYQMYALNAHGISQSSSDLNSSRKGYAKDSKVLLMRSDIEIRANL